MMKRILAATAALATVAAFSAPANAATGTVTINASVTPVCSIDSPSHSVNLHEIDVDTSGHVKSETMTQGFGNVWCNANGNTMTVTATPLTTGTAPADTSFTNRVDYKVFSAVLGSSQAVDTSGTGTATTGATLPPFETGTGTFDDYTVTTIASAKRPIAGAYTGTVTVSLTPGT
jgi:hypothetical protein